MLYSTISKFFVLAFTTHTTINTFLADHHEPTISTFAWLTDVHLDLQYNAKAPQSNWCRNASGVRTLEETQNASGRIGGKHTSHPSARRKLNEDSGYPQISYKHGRIFLPAFWGRFGCDAPLQLVRHSLHSILEETISHLKGNNKRVAVEPFVVVTGDLSAHYSEHAEGQMRWKSIEVLSSMLLRLSNDLKSSFDDSFSAAKKPAFLPKNPEILPVSLYTDATYTNNDVRERSQVIITVGNNDLPHDYALKEYDDWARNLWSIWSPNFIKDTTETRKTFLRGMYYSTPIYALNKVKAICLNTVWWSRGFSWDTSRPTDPAGQLNWLREQLEQASNQRQQVLILGHIPPGVSYYSDPEFHIQSQWFDDYENVYLDLVSLHRHIVIGQLFGHFHLDDMRLQKLSRNGDFPSKKKRSDENVDSTSLSIGSILLAPATSPVHGNNPGWRLVDLATDEVKKSPEMNLKLAKSHPSLLFSSDNKLDLAREKIVRKRNFIFNDDEKNNNQRKDGNASAPYYIQDYLQYITHLHSPDPNSLGTYSSQIAPPFVLSYSFQTLYSQKSVTTESIQSVLKLIHENQQLRDVFWKHRESLGDEPPAFLLNCVQSVYHRMNTKECINEIMKNLF